MRYNINDAVRVNTKTRQMIEYIETIDTLNDEIYETLRNDTIEYDDSNVAIKYQSRLATFLNKKTLECYVFVIDTDDNITWKKKVPKEFLVTSNRIVVFGKNCSSFTIILKGIGVNVDGNEEVIDIKKIVYFELPNE